jgi:toxin ParE1/3/4
LRLEWSPLAQRDLREAVEFIAQDSLAAADAVEDRVLAAALGLLNHPEKGRNGRRAGTREWAVPQTSHLLIYRIAPTLIEIVRVWHMSREPFS